MKKQYKYHIYKNSLIRNWTNLNGNVSKIKNFKSKEHLMLFDNEAYVQQLYHSNTNHFCILHSGNNISDLDKLEEILNRVNGPEYELDKLVKIVKDWEVVKNDHGYAREFTTNKWTLRTLQFWRERWETVAETSFSLKLNDENRLEKISDPKQNIVAHLDSQFNTLFKLGYIQTDELPKWFNRDSLEDKWVNEHHEWDFDEKNCKIYIHTIGEGTLPNPLFGDPILLTKTNGEPVFFMQLTPYHTIFVIKNNSELLKEVEERGIYAIFRPYIEMGRSYKLFIPYFGKGVRSDINLHEYFAFLRGISTFAGNRKRIKLMMLNENSPDKTKFIYDLTMAISQIRGKYDLESIGKHDPIVYFDGRGKIIILSKEEIDVYEKKINSIAPKKEIIEIHIRESSKLAKKTLNENDISVNIERFNFGNKYT